MYNCTKDCFFFFWIFFFNFVKNRFRLQNEHSCTKIVLKIFIPLVYSTRLAPNFTCFQHSSSSADDRVSTMYTSAFSAFSGLSHVSDIRLLARSDTVGSLRIGPGTSEKITNSVKNNCREKFGFPFFKTFRDGYSNLTQIVSFKFRVNDILRIFNIKKQ